MTKLKSMTAYVLEQTKIETGKMQLGGVAMALHKINEYAIFLSMPLELKMFVPCVNGEPIIIHKGEEIDDSYPIEIQKAQSEVLFEGFEWYNGISTKFAKKDFDYVGEEFCKSRTVEDVVREFDNLTLTPQAKEKYKF